MRQRSVGIVANPASGKDIRRIVTYSTPYGNQEKVNIIRRVLMALYAIGIRKVYYMPEYYNIVPQAANGIYDEHREMISDMEFEALDFMYLEKESDTIIAGKMMNEIGVDAVITLGGDGTNRAFVKEAGDLPIVPVSTGTNNAFPTMIEGTLAGLAAGIVAMGVCEDHSGVFKRTKKIELFVNGELADIALIDLVVLEPGTIGARAMWSSSGIKEIFTTKCNPASIGISAIPGQLQTITDKDPIGMHLQIGEGGFHVKSAIAPGLIIPIGIEDYEEMSIGQMISVQTPCLIALDGERSINIRSQDTAYIRLSDMGPRVVDIEEALRVARDKKFFFNDDGGRN